MGDGIHVNRGRGGNGGASTFAELGGLPEDNAELVEYVHPDSIGEVFSETWANLSNWSNVGTPSATVSGGRLRLAGTASLSTNYIRCSGYGVHNYESAIYQWSVVVSTVGASTGGKAFGLQGQNSTFPSSLHVNVEMSNSDTGRINWYLDNNTTPIQSSRRVLSGVAVDTTVYCILYRYNNRMVLRAISSSGSSIADTLYYAYPRTSRTAINPPTVANFAFYNRGGLHEVDDFTVTSTHLKKSDLLIIGDSITQSGGGYTRVPARISEKYDANVEIYAQPGNRPEDVNLDEVELYEAREILLWIGTNKVAESGAATATTSFNTLVTNLAALGYTVAAGNLAIANALPRGAASYDTFNASLVTSYGFGNVINMNGIVSDGTTTFPVSLSPDGIHPNNIIVPALSDGIAQFYRFKKRTHAYGPLTFVSVNPVTGNTGVGATYVQLVASAINATATATAAQFATGLITSTSAAAVSITTPTAALLATQLNAQTGFTYYLTVDNSAGANNVTIILGSGFTQLIRVPDGGAGDLVVPSGATGVGVFKLYFPSATTCTISRIA